MHKKYAKYSSSISNNIFQWYLGHKLYDLNDPMHQLHFKSLYSDGRNGRKNIKYLVSETLKITNIDSIPHCLAT